MILKHNVLRYCTEMREFVQDAERARQISETATQMYADTNFTRPTVQMHVKKKKTGYAMCRCISNADVVLDR